MIDREVVEIARRIKVFFCDVDGVVFPNTILMGVEPREGEKEPATPKYRSFYDGQGISNLCAIGIRVVFITNEKGPRALAIRQTAQKLNGNPSFKPQKPDGWEPVLLYEGRGGIKKLETANEFLAENGFTLEESAFMGDDLVDVNLLRAVALPAAPAQAEKAIKRICRFVSEREGGAGAIRDLTNMILEAREVDPFTLAPN